ncbi:M50 family metallopeptidase [Patescibacteria group bacterium]|nr:M50 family metallopeptidase [Patescibacteria group bacterium]
MGSILTFLIILSVLILVHELGHFFSAKRNGIKVEEFGFGYPPRLFGITKGGTIYSLNLLPFGGFVRMLGEDVGEGRQSFFVQPKSVRTTVLLAGVTMNFLLGVVLFGVIYTKLGIPEPVDYLTVVSVTADSPAEQAGIKAKDKVISFSNNDDFINYINDNRGKTISLQLSDRLVEVVPRTTDATPEGQGALGVTITNIDYVQYPFWQRPFRGMALGVKEAFAWGREILNALGQTVARLIQGQRPQDVAGPVGIYQISKSAGEQGFLAVLQFTGILSINLAILNLLPLPALDGGRLLFIGLEAISGRKVKPKLEQTIHLVGMALLIGLMILVTVNDIRRLVR